ncbi:MAG: PAS domain-containing protein [Proteobacteria bacterium]|nr:PAS domain-containing protein [Pseudomonadota bacterium]
MAIAAAALALVTVVGVIFVFVFVDGERDRDLRAWQVRMGIVADSRFAAVNDWIERQFAHVRDLAQNASLQLYLTEIALFGGDAAQVTDEPAQRTYLRNLLVAVAEAGGFSAPLRGPDISANVARVGVAGIALVDNEGRVLVATPGMPPVDDELKEIILASRGKRAIHDLRLGVDGQATMGFLAPIFALQSDESASDQIGVVVGVKEVGDELFPLLVQPGATEATAEAVLVRESGNVIEYPSPLADGTGPLERPLARDTADLAAAFALDTPGGFAVRRDYRDAEVLVVARRFAIVPWTLMYKIDAAEALAETDSRMRRMLTVFLLVIAAIATAFVAAWRHGTSRRASEAAHKANELAHRFGQQRDFLELVTDSQRSAMSIIDGDGRYLWANRVAAEINDLKAEDVVGKMLASVVGPVPAKALIRTIHEVLDTEESKIETHSEEYEDKTRTFTSEFIPLAATAELPPRVLVVSEDVTFALEERAKRARIMDQLVGTLVGLVDRRDPYSANHSAWVAKVARAIADEMELGDDDAESVEIAGRVMNLGKILVPEAILTKTEPLTEDELKLVRDSIGTSAELIEGVEFDGPVVETLRDLHAHWDGGDGVFNAEELLLTARVVAVANNFVALVSPRAYRAGLSLDAALDVLHDKIGASDTRRVITSLANYLDNHGGREALAGIGDPSPQP